MPNFDLITSHPFNSDVCNMEGFNQNPNEARPTEGVLSEQNLNQDLSSPYLSELNKPRLQIDESNFRDRSDDSEPKLSDLEYFLSDLDVKQKARQDFLIAIGQEMNKIREEIQSCEKKIQELQKETARWMDVIAQLRGEYDTRAKAYEALRSIKLRRDDSGRG